MPNPYFQFKQFTIYQDRCALKVTTDACLLGAYAAHKIEHAAIESCLDIGAGTGLLSLMIAQRSMAMIEAIEIDAAAAGQATDNFLKAPWRERLHLVHADILRLPASKQYDCIISNPPFFENDLHAPDHAKNQAKHDTSLTLHQLCTLMNLHLAPQGVCFLLLPYHRTAYVEKEVREKGLYVKERVLVQQTPAHSFFRSMLFLSRNEEAMPVETTLTIKNPDQTYTADFIALLKDYYLHL